MTYAEMLQMCCIHYANVCFGPKADKCERNWIVRYVPLATMYRRIDPVVSAMARTDGGIPLR